jgi:hypothetical protein
MRCWQRGAATLGLAALLFGGCGGDTSSTGFSSVTITAEKEQQVAGNRCAVQGHATNSGNNRARVQLSYEAKDSNGAVIATSTAEFEVAPFSNFDFSNSVLNSQGQPSSGVFSNNASCAAIDDIHRTDLNVDAV